jgi:hypothetical protein
MATGAGLVEWEQTHGKKKAKYALTSTGLLMEGVDDWIRLGSVFLSANLFSRIAYY